MPALPRSLVRSWAHYFASPWFQFLSGSLLTLSLPFWTAEISDTHNHYRTSICEIVTCSFPIWASDLPRRKGVECVLDHVSHEGSTATGVVQPNSHTPVLQQRKWGEKKKNRDYTNPFEKRPWSLLIDSRKFHESPAHQLHRQCKAFQERLGNHFTALASYPIPMDSFPRKRRNKNSNIINTGK